MPQINHYVSPIEITEFEKKHDLVLLVDEREPGKWEAHFMRFVHIEGSKSMDKIAGEGGTVDEAIEDYCTLISGKVLKDLSDNTLNIPKIIHTKK